LNALAPLRAAAQAGIYAYLPEPQASLAAGVLLGGSGHLDAAFRADLQRSGLGHLVAIDGFKQVVVAAALGGFAKRLVGPRLALVPSLSAIAAYTLVTGGHPSAVRAALMVTLASLASLSGRVADPLTSLGVALVGMAAIEPRVLLDLGLQLSLSATLGIVLLWPVLRRKLRLYLLPRWLGEPVGLSLAVSLACLPITLSTFQLVSLASPLAHVVAVPLLPAVLLGATVLALASAVPSLASGVPSLSSSVPLLALASPAVASAWLSLASAVPLLISAVPTLASTLPPAASVWLSLVAAVPLLVPAVPTLASTLPPAASIWLSLERAAPPAASAVPWLVSAVPRLPAPLLSVVSAAALSLGALAPSLTLAAPSLVSAAAWLAWLPTSLLVAVIHVFGSLPGAAITTGRMPAPAAALLAAALLLGGIWHMPELREMRLECKRWASGHRPLLKPFGLVGVCLLSAAMLQVLRPDGQLHVEPLVLPRGQAVFVRGPTGHTALLVLGGTDPTALAARVAEHMAVWEHRLDVVVAFDGRANAALGPTLARYPPVQLVVAQNARPLALPVGGGHTLRISAENGRLNVDAVGARDALVAVDGG
jgi:ComEC/Rec2-related protein